MSKAKKNVETEAKSKAVQTVEEILAAAHKAKADPNRFARGARRTAAAIRSDRFEWNRSKSTIDGVLVHYFRVRGESLTGILGPAEYEHWKGVTYKLILDDGTVTRLPGNRQLNRLIQDCGCIYQRVTIEYLGKIYKTSRHYEKIYAIHPAPLQVTSMLDTEPGRQTLQALGKAVDRPPAKKSAQKKTFVREEPRATRRRFLQGIIKGGKTPSTRVLREFAGEAWADAALKEAQMLPMTVKRFQLVNRHGSVGFFPNFVLAAERGIAEEAEDAPIEILDLMAHRGQCELWRRDESGYFRGVQRRAK